MKKLVASFVACCIIISIFSFAFAKESVTATGEDIKASINWVSDTADFESYFGQESNEIAVHQFAAPEISFDYTLAEHERADKLDAKMTIYFTFESQSYFVETSGTVDIYSLAPELTLIEGPLEGELVVNDEVFGIIVGFQKLMEQDEVGATVTLYPLAAGTGKEIVFLHIGDLVFTDEVKSHLKIYNQPAQTVDQRPAAANSIEIDPAFGFRGTGAGYIQSPAVIEYVGASHYNSLYFKPADVAGTVNPDTLGENLALITVESRLSDLVDVAMNLPGTPGMVYISHIEMEANLLNSASSFDRFFDLPDEGTHYDFTIFEIFKTLIGDIIPKGGGTFSAVMEKIIPSPYTATISATGRNSEFSMHFGLNDMADVSFDSPPLMVAYEIDGGVSATYQVEVASKIQYYFISDLGVNYLNSICDGTTFDFHYVNPA